MKPLQKTLNREYRNISNVGVVGDPKNKRLDTEYYCEGYATTFDTPYVFCEIDGVEYFEVIERNALIDADMSDVIMQYDHEGKILARQSNNTLILETDKKGLFFCSDLSKSRSAQDLHEEIKNKLVTKMSWGFTILEDSYNKETRTNYIKRVKKIYDISAVSIPANDDTDIYTRRFGGGHDSKMVLQHRKQILLLKTKLY